MFKTLVAAFIGFVVSLFGFFVPAYDVSTFIYGSEPDLWPTLLHICLRSLFAILWYRLALTAYDGIETMLEWMSTT